MPQPLHVVIENSACRCGDSAEGHFPLQACVCMQRDAALQPAERQRQSPELQSAEACTNFSQKPYPFVPTGWTYLASIKVHLCERLAAWHAASLFYSAATACAGRRLLATAYCLGVGVIRISAETADQNRTAHNIVHNKEHNRSILPVLALASTQPGALLSCPAGLVVGPGKEGCNSGLLASRHRPSISNFSHMCCLTRACNLFPDT